MLAPPDIPPDPEDLPIWQRLAWMAGIWAASVAALGVVAYVIRLWIAS